MSDCGDFILYARIIENVRPVDATLNATVDVTNIKVMMLVSKCGEAVEMLELDGYGGLLFVKIELPEWDNAPAGLRGNSLQHFKQTITYTLWTRM